MISRREFLDGLAVTAAGAAISPTAKSYAQIIGANDRVNFAVLGLNGRGYAHLSALKNNAAAARVTHVCDVDTTILTKFCGRAEKELGYAPTADQRLPQNPRLQRRRRHHRRSARPLARPHGHPRPPGRQARLRRKALQPQSSRRRAPHRSPEEVRQARPGRRPAALLRLHHQGHPADPRRPPRRRLLRQGLVREQAQIHGHRQARSRSLHPQLGPLARPRPAHRVRRQRPPLQLALAHPLRHRRIPQQRHPRSRRLSLGPRRRDIPPASPPPEAATTSKMTGSSTTPSTPASSTPAR